MFTLVDNFTVVLTNQVHVLTFRGWTGAGREAGGKEKNKRGRVRGTKDTAADGQTIFRRASRPDSGATTAIVATSEIPALHIAILSVFILVRATPGQNRYFLVQGLGRPRSLLVALVAQLIQTGQCVFLFLT